MNGFDIGLVVILLLSIMLGLLKGLTRVLIGIGALIAAFMLAAQLHGGLAAQLHGTGIPEPALMLLAYLMIFFAVMLSGGLLAYFVRKLLRAAMLSWADRMAGAALGLVATLLVAALLVLPIVAYAPFGEGALRDSVLAPYVVVVADIANRLVPEEMSERYEEKVGELRRYWRDRWDGYADGAAAI